MSKFEVGDTIRLIVDVSFDDHICKAGTVGTIVVINDYGWCVDIGRPEIGEVRLYDGEIEHHKI